MLASAAINLMQRRLGSQYARNSLLEEIRHAQNEILCLPEVPFCRVRGNEYLTTVAGQHDYVGLNYRLVTRVFTRTPDETIIDPKDTFPQSPIIGLERFNEIDYTFDCEESPDYTSTCSIHFPEEFDPGSSTDKYLLEAYVWPTQPLTETTRLVLPDQWITSLLYYAVKKRVEESAYGVDIYNDPQFKAMMASFLTKQAQTPSAVKYIRQPRF